MRIAMVSEHANPLAAVGGVDAGGQNVHVDALAKGLVDRGHEVTVFSRRDSTTAAVSVAAPGGYEVRHVTAGPPADVPKDDLWRHMPAFAGRLAEAWAEEAFDVAHAHFWMSGWATMTAAAETGVPWAQTFHALGSVKRRHQGGRDTSPPDRIDVERELCSAADAVVATCRDEVRELEALGLDRGRARIVPCGVDVDHFVAAAHRRPGRRLLAVGRLVERKGIDDAVRALAALPGATLTVAGGPAADALDLDPEAQRLRSIADELGCADRLELLGAVGRDRMPQLLAAADVVVATPWYEPFGIVPLEAMAVGRPVVGTAVGGLLDTVVPGVTGELVPQRDPVALAATLGRLVDDPDRIRRYGQAGARRARAAYGWDRVAEATESVLSSLTSLSRSPQEARP
jgi:glycosyltransferase involved in cell wall biosynthesis